MIDVQEELKLAGGKLVKVVKEKDIGVLVHNSTKPSVQCSQSAKRANLVLDQIRRMFHFKDQITLSNSSNF